MPSDQGRTPRRSRFSFETIIVFRAALCALPGVLVSLYFLIQTDARWETWVTTLVLVLLPFPMLAWHLQDWITNPLKVAVNVLSAIREGDFTLRSRRTTELSGTIVDLYQEINALAMFMENTRISGIETQNAIDKITANIDVATLIVDSRRKVAQANEAAKHLISSINHWELSPIGRTVDELNIGFCIDASDSDFSRFSFVDAQRRFEGRRGIFRMNSERFDLVVLTDITKAASEQERESWKRLLRVLGHELNNSIAPIHSLASTLSKMTRRAAIEEETKTDILGGLDAIATRSDSIIRFMHDYTRLAKLPEPELGPCDLESLLSSACQLFGDSVRVSFSERNIIVLADERQLEQALINLLKNATEATGQTADGVTCATETDNDCARVRIIDSGPGIANPDNLFVPFYTTKERGSGIGLALSKQIIEAAGGSISLTNRSDASGCEATVQLELYH